MFESLKKKLSSWLGKPAVEEKKSKKKAKSKKEKPKKAKEKKPKKQKAEKTLARAQSQITHPIKPISIKQEPKELISKTEEITNDELIEHELIQHPKETEEITNKPSIKHQLIKEPLEHELIQPSQEIKEIEEPEEKQGFFARFKKRFSTSTLQQEHIDALFPDLEMILLENNVALEVVDKIKENLSKDLVGIEVKKDKIEETIMASLKSSINDVLIEPPDLIKQIKESPAPFIILLFGINGSGKTTSIAKLASLLKKNNISCVLAAADTFRAASIEQLKTHGERLKIPVIAQSYGSDPAAVAFDAITYAKKNKIKAVLIDTAGRMYTKANLLKEMEKIVRISKPNLKIFVGESITGNDAVDQAKTFNESIGIDGIILSKADVDEKAGTILSVSYVTKKPIYFLGTGQDYNDLQPFKKDIVLKHLGLEQQQNPQK